MRAGLITAALYGAEVAPVESDTISKMRTAAIRAEGIWTSQVSQDVYWLIVGAHNDPAFIAAAKPLARIAREVWYLDSNAAYRQSHHDRLAGLEMHELHKAIKTDDPPSMIVQGIQNSCRQLAVEMETPTRWRLGTDTVIDITVSPKPMLMKSLAKQWERMLKEKVSKVLKLTVDFEVSTFQKLYNKYDLQKRRMLVQLIAGQVYTATKAASIGVEVHNTCSICQKEPDTIQHRLSGCNTSGVAA
jgi:hypothetical protein